MFRVLVFGFSSDDLALVLFLGLYSVLLTVNTQSIITVIAVLIPVSVAVFYLFYRDDRALAAFNLSPRASFAVACTAAIMLAVFIGAYTSCRYLTFGSPNYDFGIFCNMFASMARDFTQTVSSERDAIIQHFAVHFSPVYYLMLPFYYIFRSPVTLQILQALIVASGIIPLWLISRGCGLSPRASAVLSAIYAIYPAISGGCSYDLHENCFLTAFLSVALLGIGAAGQSREYSSFCFRGPYAFCKRGCGGVRRLCRDLYCGCRRP